MQNTGQLITTLELDTAQINQIKASLLMEMIQSVHEDKTIRPEFKPYVELILTKHSLDVYLDQKLELDKQNKNTNEKDERNDESLHSLTTSIPLKEDIREKTLGEGPLHLKHASRPHIRKESRKFELDLEKVSMGNLKGKKTGKVKKKPNNELDATVSTSNLALEAKDETTQENRAVKIEDLVHITRYPPKNVHVHSRRAVRSLDEKKLKEPLKQKESSKTKSSTRAEVASGASIGPLRKTSGGSSKTLFIGSNCGESPRRKTISPSRNSPPCSDFYESLPIDKDVLKQYLKVAEPFLKEKDSKIQMLDDLKRTHLSIIVTPQRDMKTNTEYSAKTIILVDKKKLEGEAANKVFKGYEIINGNYLAVKILNIGVTDEPREKEIQNLKQRGWFYGCYQLVSEEYALAMKLIPGDTLLQILYVIDEGVAHDSIYAAYCTEKKTLSFELQYQIIIELIKEVSKLHEKYELLHRDLKPANIKVYFEKEKLKVRIIDFGDAVAVGSEAIGLTGTNGYSHPEIDLVPYSKAHDIFSLGVIIGEILTRNNRQLALNEYKQKNIREIVTPIMKPSQIKAGMTDVFNPKIAPDEYHSYKDHQSNMQNFIQLELKKLARKMMDTGLRNSSLQYEITRIEALVLDSEKFSKKMYLFFQNKEKVERSLNRINKKFNAGLFFPQKEITVSSSQDATEWFKRLHAETDEDEYIAALLKTSL